MKITPGQAEALARFLLTIRPDWSKFYTTEAVRDMRHISDDLETITAAAVRGALTPKIAKPDVLAMHGEHWKRPTTPGRSQGAVTEIDGRCGDCGRLHVPSEPCPPPAEDTSAATAAGVHAARQALTETRAGLCPCGVLARDCADHREPAEQPEETTDEPF